MQDCVTKFSHACTFDRRGETPAPQPEKRLPALPRPQACRALSRQIGKYVCRAMLAVFRTGPCQHLAFAWQPRLQDQIHALKLSIGPGLSRGAREIRIGPSHPRELASARLGASEAGSDVLNGGLRAIAPLESVAKHWIFPPAPSAKSRKSLYDPQKVSFQICGISPCVASFPVDTCSARPYTRRRVTSPHREATIWKGRSQ
jgi:hypothetical protein